MSDDEVVTPSEVRSDDEVVTPREVSKKYQIPEATLAQWRYLGKGPSYLKLGAHVRYRRSALTAWERAAEHAPEAS